MCLKSTLVSHFLCLRKKKITLPHLSLQGHQRGGYSSLYPLQTNVLNTIQIPSRQGWSMRAGRRNTPGQSAASLAVCGEAESHERPLSRHSHLTLALNLCRPGGQAAAVRTESLSQKLKCTLAPLFQNPQASPTSPVLPVAGRGAIRTV